MKVNTKGIGIWHFFLEQISDNNLLEIFNEHFSSSRVRGVDGICGNLLSDKRDLLSSEIEIIIKRIHEGNYRFSRYKVQLISKGSNKPPRVLSIPTLRDRLVLKALNDSLVKFYPKFVSQLPQTVVREIKDEIIENKYDAFLKLDVKNFYPSIDRCLLHKQLLKIVKSTKIIRIIMQAVSTAASSDDERLSKKGVPQGIAISNFLGEIIGQSVLQNIKRDCRSQHINVHVFRFVDDMLILCRHDTLCDLQKIAKKDFEKENLHIHPIGERGSGKSYTGYISDGFDFLGYAFKGNLITVRPSSVQKVQSSLARCCTKGKYKALREVVASQRSKINKRTIQYLNLVISGCFFQKRRRGWLAYYSQISDFSLLRRLDVKVLQLVKRFKLDKSKIHSFVRTYRELHKDPKKWKYIPNYDQFDVEDKRRTLNNFGLTEIFQDGERKPLSETSDELIDRTFDRFVLHAVSNLEEDILNLS